MSLLDLPPEVLVLVTDYLHGYEAILLYCTGLRAMQAKIQNGGMRRLIMRTIPSRLYKLVSSHKLCTYAHCSCLVRYQSFIPNIETVVYDGIYFSREWQRAVTPTMSLNLQELYLSFLGNLVYFSSYLWNSNVYLNELLPYLRRLTLHGSSSTPYWHLPEILCVDFLLASLPRNLLQFIARFGVLDSTESIPFATKRFTAELPPTLEILGFTVIGDIQEERRLNLGNYPPIESYENVKLEHEPHIYRKTGEIPKHWPLFLPKGLTEVSFRQYIARYNEPDLPSDLDWIEYLPSELKHFKLCVYSGTVPLRLLPPSLTSFDFNGNCNWDGAYLTNLKTLTTNQWPPRSSVPSLTSLNLDGCHLPYFENLEQFYRDLEWPIEIKCLTICHKAVGITNSLPRSLIELTLWTDFSTNAIAIENTYFDMPSQLMHLKLHRIGSLSISFFQRQWPQCLQTLIVSYRRNGPDQRHRETADPKLALSVLKQLPQSLTILQLDWNVRMPLGTSVVFPPNLTQLSLKNTPFEMEEVMQLPKSLISLKMLEIRFGTFNAINEDYLAGKKTYQEMFLESFQKHLQIIPQMVSRFPDLNLGSIPLSISENGIEALIKLSTRPEEKETGSELMVSQHPVNRIIPSLSFCHSYLHFLRHFTFIPQKTPSSDDAFRLLP